MNQQRRLDFFLYLIYAEESLLSPGKLTTFKSNERIVSCNFKYALIESPNVSCGGGKEGQQVPFNHSFLPRPLSLPPLQDTNKQGLFFFVRRCSIPHFMLNKVLLNATLDIRQTKEKLVLSLNSYDHLYNYHRTILITFCKCLWLLECKKPTIFGLIMVFWILDILSDE